MLPSRPGWYPNPLDRAYLRYWDGREWSARSRPRPPWATGLADFEPAPGGAERAIEGPVHPRELREPVTSGASWRDGVGRWSGLHAQRPWHRGSLLVDDPTGSPSSLPSAKFASARRPLILFVAMVLVAAAVVISSVAVMSPYDRGGITGYSTPVVDRAFTRTVEGDCAAILPGYAAALLPQSDTPAALDRLVKASQRLDALRLRISRIRVPVPAQPLVTTWLGDWRDVAALDRRYANVVAQAQPTSAAATAERFRQDALGDAGQANRYAVDQLGLNACELPGVPAA